MKKEVREYTQKIWDYHLMHQKIEKADAIFVLGSHDIRVAERGAELYLAGLAPLLIFSGGFGTRASGVHQFTRPEAVEFSERAKSMGVPEKAIIIEDQSTNTGENISFTQKLLNDKGIFPKSMILVQKPYMERRTYATFCKRWEGISFSVTSPKIPLESYPNEDISEERMINAMVGDLQRIKEYPNKGFQIFQEIPDDVWMAYEKLVALGYNKKLIKE